LERLEILLGESPVLALAIVFWVGAVASLSSCAAIRLPIVLGYVAAAGGPRRRSLLLTALFLVGLVASYALIGSAAAFLGGIVHRLLLTNKFIFWIAGLSLVATGILVSGTMSTGLLPQRWRDVGARLERARPAGALLFGFLFGLLLMPACPLCGAGLIVLAAVVAAKNLSLYGIAVFISFALGQGLPIAAVGVLTALAKPDLLKRLRKRLCSIDQRVQLLCGNLLTVLGLYFIIVG